MDPHTSTTSRLSGITGLCVEEAFPILGGRSRTEKYSIRIPGGDRFFIKVASPSSSSSRSNCLLEREASLLSRLPQDLRVPRFIDYRETRGWVVLITEHVEGHHGRTWSRESAASAFRATVDLYSELEQMEITAPPIQQRSSRFITFERLSTLPRFQLLGDRERCWLIRNGDLLVALEEKGRVQVDADTLMHCDLAVDNIIFHNFRGPCFTDWSHAHLGNHLYDIATMLIRIRADGAWSTVTDSLLRARIRGTPSDEWRSMVVLATGAFLKTSEGERESHSRSLSEERLRYARTGVRWLMEIT